MEELQKKMKFMKLIDKHLFINKKKVNQKDTIIIVGTPRSGSTWLMEILETIPEYTYLFEPINPIYCPEAFNIGFKSRHYIAIDKDWPEAEEYLKRVFTGQVFGHLDPYKLKYKVMRRRVFADKLIVKFIKFNRMLPWASNRFQLRGKFFIIRHPCAVIASQLKTDIFGYHPTSPPIKGIFPTHKQIIEEASQIDFLDSSLLKKIKTYKTKEEMLAVVWCLDNLVPLTSPKPHPWTTVIYEKLVKDGKREISRIFKEINEEIPESALKQLREPSMLTMKSDEKYLENTNKQLSKWKKYLSKKQISRILSIVEEFGLDFYNKDIEPDYSNKKIKY